MSRIEIITPEVIAKLNEIKDSNCGHVEAFAVSRGEVTHQFRAECAKRKLKVFFHKGTIKHLVISPDFANVSDF